LPDLFWGLRPTNCSLQSRKAKMNMPAAANGTAQLIDTARVILSRLLESVDPPEELLPQIEAVKEQLATDLRMEDLGELLEVVAVSLLGPGAEWARNACSGTHS